MKRSLTIFALFGLLSIPTLSFAQDAAPSADDIKKAAAAFDRGRDAFRLSSYVEAAEQFEAADDFAQSALSLRFAMLARKEAGQLDRAATHASLALELYPDAASLGKDEQTLVTEAQALLDEQGTVLGKLNVSCSERCDLLLDNKLVHGKSAETRSLYVQPGAHTVRATWSEKRGRTEKVKVAAGSAESVIFVAPAIPEAAPEQAQPVANEQQPAAEEKKGGWSPAVFWTGAAVTAVGIGASTFLGIRALNEPGQEAVRTGCAGQSTDCELYQQGLQNQMVANIAIGATVGVGLFTIVTGIWLTDWSGGDKPSDSARRSGGTARGSSLGEPRAFSVRPTFSIGDGATVGAVGSF
ncbi:MAG TPA: hypothetical protein VLC09_18970 [Polyangiaceae bacterium]|nr:hypothetical protein [Polyangiaceae bacterium]